MQKRFEYIRNHFEREQDGLAANSGSMLGRLPHPLLYPLSQKGRVGGKEKLFFLATVQIRPFFLVSLFKDAIHQAQDFRHHKQTPPPFVERTHNSGARALKQLYSFLPLSRIRFIGHAKAILCIFCHPTHPTQKKACKFAAISDGRDLSLLEKDPPKEENRPSCHIRPSSRRFPPFFARNAQPHLQHLLKVGKI